MRNVQSGFSLLEGMVVISIASVLLLMVAPMFFRVASEQQLTAYTNDLVGNLQSARRMAIARRVPVSLCSSDNGQRCTDSPWARGYILFADGGEAGVMDGPDRAIKAVTGRDTKLRVTLNGASYVRFLGNGGLIAGLAGESAHPGNRAPTLFTRLLKAFSPVTTAHADFALEPIPVAGGPVAFLVCSGKAGRTVRLNNIGRVNTTTVSCH